MLSKTSFLNVFKQNLLVTPTQGQWQAMQLLSDFVNKVSSENELFILSGYAGTGKTTLVSALVNTLIQNKKKCVLLAPTGRAAKVFANYSSQKAYTIHKHIYRVKRKQNMLTFTRRKNKFSDVIFLVDEVSMLSANSQTQDTFTRQNLLDDLIEYVYEGENCKLLFIGDDAQLPPVHAMESPALDAEFLKQSYNVEISQWQLTEVIRQSLHSGVLYNATLLRKKIEEESLRFPLFSKRLFPDFNRLSGEDLEEKLNDLYGKYETEEIVIITRSNKRAYSYNREIRNRIFYRENRVTTGDYLMVVKNNYYWIDDISEIGFIANGDIIEILSIQAIRSLHGFTFADATIRLCDYPNSTPIDVKLILESLESEEASLPYEQNNLLYQSVAEDYKDIASARARYMNIRNDPFLNAIQVKFAYALTCHKTQGGQWKVVLLDAGYFEENRVDKEFLRWLYTAVTRTTEKIYLINFHDNLFGNDNEKDFE
jgi:ATP-dependent exoDNAse (exonuclease V) alpha subunit